MHIGVPVIMLRIGRQADERRCSVMPGLAFPHSPTLIRTQRESVQRRFRDFPGNSQEVPATRHYSKLVGEDPAGRCLWMAYSLLVACIGDAAWGTAWTRNPGVRQLSLRPQRPRSIATRSRRVPRLESSLPQSLSLKSALEPTSPRACFQTIAADRLRLRPIPRAFREHPAPRG